MTSTGYWDPWSPLGDTLSLRGQKQQTVFSARLSSIAPEWAVRGQDPSANACFRLGRFGPAEAGHYVRNGSSVVRSGPASHVSQPRETDEPARWQTQRARISSGTRLRRTRKPDTTHEHRIESAAGGRERAP